MKKIAVPVVNGNVNGHFGHSEQFNFYTLDNNKNIESVEIFEHNKGCGCRSGLAGILNEKGITLVLAGNLGEGAKMNLNAAGIEVLTGFSGNAGEAVKQWAAGIFKTEITLCSSHEHGHLCNRH